MPVMSSQSYRRPRQTVGQSGFVEGDMRPRVPGSPSPTPGGRGGTAPPPAGTSPAAPPPAGAGTSPAAPPPSIFGSPIGPFPAPADRAPMLTMIEPPYRGSGPFVPGGETPPMGRVMPPLGGTIGGGGTSPAFPPGLAVSDVPQGITPSLDFFADAVPPGMGRIIGGGAPRGGGTIPPDAINNSMFQSALLQALTGR